MQIAAYGEPSNAFVGVRFLQVGFDSIREDQVRSKLLEGRGIDAINYGPHCTHIIVDNLVYDDPMCAAARRDGKILVTGLWVDHSFDVGMPVDPTNVIYRPVRDLNGIPGAKSLVMCLTGYQRHERDDIMTMVALMGANFSKPLVANKVTHLICYKFEGEKYELGRKVKTMKLVNHHWLQDCLMAWELLPEADYAKSAYELEMEAEAKVSEEETEDVVSVDLQKKSIISPQNTRVENKNFHQSPEQQGVSRNSSYLTAFESFACVGSSSKTQSTPIKETDYGKQLFSRETHDEHREMSNTSCGRSPNKMFSKVPSNVPDGKLIPEKIEHVLASTYTNAKKSVDGGSSKLTSKSMKASLPLRSERIENNSCSPLSNVSKPGLGGLDVPPERHLDQSDSHGIRTPLKGTSLHPDEGQSVGLRSTKKPTITRSSSRSPILCHSPSKKRGLATIQIEMPVSRSSIDGLCQLASDVSPTNITSFLREEVNGGFIMQSEKDQDGNVSGGVKTPLKGALVDLNEEPSSSLPGRKKMVLSYGGSKSTKLSHSPKICMGSRWDTKPMERPVSVSPIHGSRQLAVDVLATNISSSLREEESCVFLLQPERDQDGNESGIVKTPLKGASLHLNEEQISGLPTKKMTTSRGSSKSKKLGRSIKKSMGSPLDTKAAEMLAFGSSIHGSHQSNIEVYPPTNTNSHLREELSIFFKEAAISTSRENSLKTNDQMLQHSRGRPKKQRLPDLEVNDPSSSRIKSCTSREDMQRSDAQGTEPPSGSSRLDKLDGQADLNSSKVDHSGSKSLKKKMLARKTLGARPTISRGRTTKHKGFISAVFQNELTSQTSGAVITENTNNVSLSEKLVDVPPPTNVDVSIGHGNEAPKFERPIEKSIKIKKGAKSKVEKTNDVKKSVGSQNMELPESISTGDVAEGKTKVGKKHSSAKSKIIKLMDPTEKTKQDEEKTVSHNEEMVVLAVKTFGKKSKKLKDSDVEKENKPITNGQQSVTCDTEAAGKLTKKSLKNACKTGKANMEDLNTKTEPAWFILSGHRLQRKEFQHVIRRLKGRVCRDTHNWSYQATHFIVPDPIRRTEKFFAAAASGSWILKTDYLTASNEAGRFLYEEPYEWHKKLLTEDGAINLEAPRKWRLLRERTGHGAFYGMRIIIYGECIAPPLDTLKRVVKAGDGTILATSPPYTRLLNTNVDFAIVSPGMPRVDMWVQEFLRHEIPCISADYLVEYVCKPGNSLERHVLYNTQAWAQRSLESLVNCVEEVVEDPKTPEDDDVSCQVCGIRDRGDEMLLCGDESGTYGCGVGTHIDCLDPPLEDVPEEDWYCGECCRKREKRTSIH